VLLVSVTSGNAGHHEMAPDALARRRAEEAARAGAVIGARYLVLDHDDGRLVPDLEVREELIGLIRRFGPDLLLGPRPFDYHPDHRAVGRLMVDASYLLTVPLIRPDVPSMERMPVIAYTCDGFRKPAPFEPDVVIGIDDQFEKKARMLACHESQVYEWIPFNRRYVDSVPEGPEERWEWFRRRCRDRFGRTARRFRRLLVERYGQREGQRIQAAEAFEICEYGRRPDADLLERLFPA
jgi:LmbE family N-acetylglucosaminyl deacetylase